MCFVNKIDKIGADFKMCIDDIRDRLSTKAFAVQLPYGEGSEFKGIVHLINMKYYTFEGANGETQVEHDIPADFVDECTAAREKLIDTLTMFSDDIAELYLGGEEVSEDLQG